jgi:serine/threonine-protein kinase
MPDETAVTGIRELSSAPGRAAGGSARLDSWDADDGLESQAPVRAGELLGGKYVVEGMFAEGGMGIVCLGRHAQLDQPVAIKFLRRALSGSDAIVQRFLNEARALAALRSEHVVRVMDVGQLESGRPYLVMEHLDGMDLQALISRDGPLTVDTAIKYVLQVCEPLAEAHALGIIHRDVKPENLFLWSGGPGKDTVKVLDFGLAKRLGSAATPGATGPQDSLGSPWYMSPEQIVSPHLVDSRTDIWSLGVVLHQLLTDSLPFDGPTATAVFGRVLSAAPKPLGEALPGADDALASIVGRCLEKEPDNRYATISDLRDALTAYLAQREAGFLPESPSASSAPRELLPVTEFEDDTKIRIPGVHARWPGVIVVALLLVAIATYGAEKTGRVRLRETIDGWLNPARLGFTPTPPMPRKSYEPPLDVARGVFSRDPVLDAAGQPMIRAEPEKELQPSASLPTAPREPINEAEQARRQAEYRDFLTNNGLVPLGDALPNGAEASADTGANATPPSTAPPPQDAPELP